MGHGSVHIMLPAVEYCDVISITKHLNHRVIFYRSILIWHSTQNEQPFVGIYERSFKNERKLAFCLCENIKYQHTNSKFIFLYLKIEERVVFVLLIYNVVCYLQAKTSMIWMSAILFFISLCDTKNIIILQSKRGKKISMIEQQGKLLHHFYI